MLNQALATPDERRELHDCNALSAGVPTGRGLSDQTLTRAGSNRPAADPPPPESKNPGALAGATGADRKSKAARTEEEHDPAEGASADDAPFRMLSAWARIGGALVRARRAGTVQLPPPAEADAIRDTFRRHFGRNERRWLLEGMLAAIDPAELGDVARELLRRSGEGRA